MDKLPSFVDMALTPQEKAEEYPSLATPGAGPKYPYGLCLCFTQEELEKLDLADDCEPGDYVILHCLARVTSVSKNKLTNAAGQDEVRTRVEMQIEGVAAEGEEEGESQDDKPMRKAIKSPYA